MNILITGCAGFIGFHSTLKFLNEGYKVIGIYNLNNYYSPKLKKNRLKYIKNKFKNNFKFYRLDLEDYSEIKKVYKYYKIGTVLHLGAQAGVRYSIENPEVYIKSNINGFYNIIELSRLNKIKNFLYASSSSVYGNNRTYPLNEDLNTDNPLSLYAASKKTNELIANSYFNIFKFKSVGLRFFTVYGPFGRPDMIIYKLFESIYFKTKINIYNNGNHFRDFTFVDDVTEYIYRLLKNRSKLKNGAEILNVGCGNSISLKKIIQLVEKITNSKLKYKPVDMQLGDVIKTHSDTSKIKQITKYKAKYNYVEGINIFHEWFKSYHKI